MFTIFSQRDVRWASKTLGKTNRTMAAVGCTTTDVAMSGTWFGDTILPGDLCKKLRYTADALLIWASIAEVFPHMKFLWRFYSYDQVLIDEALKNPNKTVLLNVDSGRHWVHALSRIPFTRTFWVADPWTGTKKMYSGVIGGAILTKK